MLLLMMTMMMLMMMSMMLCSRHKATLLLHLRDNCLQLFDAGYVGVMTKDMLLSVRHYGLACVLMLEVVKQSALKLILAIKHGSVPTFGQYALIGSSGLAIAEKESSSCCHHLKEPRTNEIKRACRAEPDLGLAHCLDVVCFREDSIARAFPRLQGGLRLIH
mmetsp:Transcript_36536/g.96414  ORF Transcript_36536/g.96414 Transcript_36536/m.96414 type:complete len:162 (+) Transcript_36536:705-1190(+)